MATNYIDVLVQCPYYKSTKDKVIRCEGLDEHSTVALSFHTTEHKSDYMEKYCDRSYYLCRICKMLGEKYE